MHTNMKWVKACLFFSLREEEREPTHIVREGKVYVLPKTLT